MTGDPHIDPDPETDGESLVWSNVYLSFPLTRRERAVLDAYLRSQESSLSMRLRVALVETFREAGVDLPQIG
ncbi:hypothetical protein [Rhodococcus koreensis]|uniref:Uncharacterized protein n=1 Tax=Rhodococcus koreensis TaxID=99653 RepID=A0A1H4KY95_9NOCA|nr:hypothetical protein [Rhodococcus koreensis]SEB63186.1 hypothetical protein SAMN04490239_0968 [Rhodococcus koreensis]